MQNRKRGLQETLGERNHGVYLTIANDRVELEFNTKKGSIGKVISLLSDFFKVEDVASSGEDNKLESEVHEMMLEILFSHLKEVRMSEKEYKEFAKSMKERFEYEFCTHSRWQIMRAISDAPMLKIPVENYLNFPYEIPDISQDEINGFLQMISNKLNKEAIDGIKNRIDQEPENPVVKA